MILLALACGGPPTFTRAVPAHPVLPLCADTPRAEGTLDLTLVRGAGVSDATLSHAVSLLEGRLGLQGIELGTISGPEDLGARYALGRPPNAPGASLGPLADFLKTSHQGVQLVVVEAVVDPRSALAGDIHLAGLGVHPSAVVSPEAEVVRAALPAGFDPTLVVAAPALTTEAGGDLLLHELGHALGLSHANETIMTPGPQEGPCVQGFSQQELVQLTRSSQPGFILEVPSSSRTESAQ